MLSGVLSDFMLLCCLVKVFAVNVPDSLILKEAFNDLLLFCLLMPPPS